MYNNLCAVFDSDKKWKMSDFFLPLLLQKELFCNFRVGKKYINRKISPRLGNVRNVLD